MAAGRPRILVVTGGHRFDAAAFSALWDNLPGVDWQQARHPEAQALLSPDGAADFAALVFYDIPGIRFRSPGPPELLHPPKALQDGFAGLIAAGKPMLFLHHSMAGWPLWDDYARLVGARFFYEPGQFAGKAHPASGFRGDVAYTARAVGAHPVTNGLEDGLTLVDELYLFQLLDPDILPILRADHHFSNKDFHSAAAALRGAQAAASSALNPGATDLVAWARAAGCAPVVAIQPGDGAETFANPGYRRLIANTIGWLTSPEAARWAAAEDERKRHDP